MMMSAAKKQNSGKVGDKKAAMVTANHALRRLRKSCCAVKSATTGRANQKTVEAITSTNASCFRLGLLHPPEVSVETPDARLLSTAKARADCARYSRHDTSTQR